MTKTNRIRVVADNDWTPRSLPGGIYCSPRCGGDKGFCKRSEYDRAVRAAADLAARLGDGWTPRVWENLGWHWEVEKSDKHGNIFERSGIIVRQCRDGKYEAEFRCNETMMDHTTQFHASAETPEDAVGNVRQDVRTFIARVEAVLSATI